MCVRYAGILSLFALGGTIAVHCEEGASAYALQPFLFLAMAIERGNARLCLDDHGRFFVN